MFQVPDIQSKTVTKNTLKTYKTCLNKLSAAEISTVSELVAHQDKAIEIAKKETKGDESKMRIFLSACFYVLSDMPNESKTKLFNEFQKYKDPKYRKDPITSA